MEKDEETKELPIEDEKEATPIEIVTFLVSGIGD